MPLDIEKTQQTNKTNATTQRNKYILERIYIPRCPCFLRTLWALLLSCLKLTTLDLVCIHIFTMYGITIGPVMPNLCIVVLWPPLAPFQMCQNWKMCRLSPVASDIPESKTNKKEVEIVGWPECERSEGKRAAPRVSTCLLPISGRAYPWLLTRAFASLPGSPAILHINRFIRIRPWDPNTWVRTQINGQWSIICGHWLEANQ